jgi:ABC-type phosphate transport system substrate-binding protein
MAPLLARWADAYARRQPAVTLVVEGRGSESGIRSLLEGTADIAALSRPLDSSEAKALTARFGGFEILPVGLDTLRLMARRGSLAWADPGSAAKAFHPGGPQPRPVGRLPLSGTRREALQMLKIETPRRGVLGLVSPIAVQLALRADGNLVGYGSNSVRLSDVENLPGPTLVRPLSLVVSKSSSSNPVLPSFLRFLASDQAREILRQSGFAPVDAP